MSPPPGPGARAEVARVEAPAGGTRPSEGRATTVLALPRSETPTQWVLYCYEGEYPGSGIPDAARYAERPAAARDRRTVGRHADERRGAEGHRRNRGGARDGARGPRPVEPRERTNVRAADRAGNYSPTEEETKRGPQGGAGLPRYDERLPARRDDADDRAVAVGEHRHGDHRGREQRCGRPGQVGRRDGDGGGRERSGSPGEADAHDPRRRSAAGGGARARSGVDRRGRCEHGDGDAEPTVERDGDGDRFGGGRSLRRRRPTSPWPGRR